MLRRFLPLFVLGLTLQAALPPGKPLNDVPIRNPKGPDFDLKTYRGKVVLIALISTTCEHCVFTIELLTRLQKEYGPKGVQIIGASGEGDATLSAQFADRYRPNFPFGFVGRASFMKLADIPADRRPFVPVLIFVDPKGSMRAEFFGDEPGMKQDTMESGIRRALDQIIGETHPMAPASQAKK